MKKIMFIAYLLLIAALCFGISETHAQAWTPNKKYIKAKDTSKPATTSKYQCYGTTQKGERCKRHVPQDHGFCYQHIEQAK